MTAEQLAKVMEGVPESIGIRLRTSRHGGYEYICINDLQQNVVDAERCCIGAMVAWLARGDAELQIANSESDDAGFIVRWLDGLRICTEVKPTLIEALAALCREVDK